MKWACEMASRSSTGLQGLWFIALLGLFLTSLAASWLLQASMHYQYAFWYQALHIDAHIETFAPQNKFILGLDAVPATEHVRLFNAISEAVHNQGKGLADIQFFVQGKAQALLHRAEIVHLQDVAALIDTLQLAAWIIAGLTLVLLGYLVRQRIAPAFASQLGYLFSLLIVITTLVLMVGPKAVFYQFHVWVFPDDHPWFFYYQDSLMSTLMKAPDLFGGIAVAIFMGALVIFSALILLLKKVWRP